MMEDVTYNFATWDPDTGRWEYMLRAFQWSQFIDWPKDEKNCPTVMYSRWLPPRATETVPYKTVYILTPSKKDDQM
jgi:hypothetical protein